MLNHCNLLVLLDQINVPGISLDAQLAIDEDSQFHKRVRIDNVQTLDHASLVIGEGQEIVLENQKGTLAASAQSVHVDHLPSMSMNINTIKTYSSVIVFMMVSKAFVI